MNDKEENKEGQENPIDKDKITETPHSLPYAHHVGSAQIKPLDRGKIRSKAVTAMQDRAQQQMKQIREQIELLAKQANNLKQRVEISHWIYQAEMSFEPVVGQLYHLYQKEDGKYVVAMIGPNEWGRSFPYEKFISTIRLLGDNTWEIMNAEDFAQVFNEDDDE